MCTYPRVSMSMLIACDQGVIHPGGLGRECARDPAWNLWQHATRCAAVGKLATMRPHLANAAVAGARPTRLRHAPLSMLCLCLCSHQSDPLRVTCPPTVPSLVAPRGNDHTWCAPHCLPTRRRARTTTARAYVRAFPGVQLHALSRSVTTGCLARAQGRA